MSQFRNKFSDLNNDVKTSCFVAFPSLKSVPHRFCASLHFRNQQHNFSFDRFCPAWWKHPHDLFDEIGIDAELSVLTEKCQEITCTGTNSAMIDNMKQKNK